MPQWLDAVAEVSLAAAVCCAAAIAVDIAAGHRQKMWIMNVVWPVTALWAGPVGLYAYFRFGRGGRREKPFREIVAVAATHCGAGCTLGDICAEWLHFAFPFTIAGFAIFGAWTIDYALALAFGIAFQYFTIVPMRNLPVGKGLVQALKADFLSLTAWQVGMYGWMALMRFAVFGRDLPKTSPAFWFLMQIAMAAGFVTAYPVNWWLVRSGVKEKM
jgi:hypothetical protein